MGFFGDLAKGFANSMSGGLFDIGASLLGGIMNQNSQESANAANVQMTRETNQANKDIAAMNNQAAMDLQRENNEWSRQQAIDMFNMENEYNSPLAQKERLLEAGFNPAAAMDGSVSVSSGNGDITTPSSIGVPNLSTPNLSAPSVQPVMPWSYGFVDALTKMADANFKFSQGSSIREKLPIELEKLINENDSVQQDVIQKQIKNSLDQYFGFNERNTDLELKRETISEILARAELLRRQGDHESAKILLTNAETFLKENENEFKRVELQYLRDYLQARNASIAMDKQVKSSQVDLNKANTNLANENARDVRMTRESRIAVNDSIANLNRSLAQLNDTENAFKNQTLQTRVRQEFEKLSQMEFLTEQEKANVSTAIANMERAQYENDMKKWTYWKNFGCDIVNTAANAVNSVKGFGFAPISSSANVQVDNVPHDYRQVVKPGEKFYDPETGEVGVYPDNIHRIYY